MEGIKLVRLDYRLIHGQVITKWKNVIQTTDIIIVDDGLVKDDFMKDIYVMAAPPGVQVQVISVDDFIVGEQTGQYEKGNILLLVKTVDTLSALSDKGILFPEVQIGGLGGGKGRRQIVTGVNISPEEETALRELSGKGVSIYFQVTPEEKKTKFQGIS